jgi:hypothetical protein
MTMPPNQRGAGDGGTAHLRRAERQLPAAPDHERWAATFPRDQRYTR